MNLVVDTEGEMDRVIEVIVKLGKLPRIGPDDDIYDAGFASQKALELILELEAVFAVTIPDDGSFGDARTPRALQRMIQELNG